MAWTNRKGFNFRAALGFVTDGTNETGDIGAAYPRSVTVDGDTFDIGWSTDKTAGTGDNSVRDRIVTDARLSGIAFRQNTSAGVHTFRINLPAAGNYAVRIAVGDISNPRTNYVRILDTATQLFSLSNVATAEAEFYDASGVLRTSGTDWVNNNAEATFSFATTICYLEIGTSGGSGADTTGLAHFAIRSAVSSYTPRGTLLGVG